jgi:hypothetical protein
VIARPSLPPSLTNTIPRTHRNAGECAIGWIAPSASATRWTRIGRSWLRASVAGNRQPSVCGGELRPLLFFVPLRIVWVGHPVISGVSTAVMIPTHKKKINAKKKDDPSDNHDRCLHYQSSKGEIARPSLPPFLTNTIPQTHRNAGECAIGWIAPSASATRWTRIGRSWLRASVAGNRQPSVCGGELRPLLFFVPLRIVWVGHPVMIPTHKKKINAKKKDDPSGNHDRCLHYQSSKGESGRPVEPRRAATSTKSHPKARRGSSQKQAKGETTDPLAESSLEYSIALSYCCSLRLNKD